MENLKTCKKCGGNACYEQKVNEEITTWLCMGCGFTTSTLMEKGSKVVNDLLETSPELYKDLLFEDKDNNMWTPATIHYQVKQRIASMPRKLLWLGWPNKTKHDKLIRTGVKNGSK